MRRPRPARTFRVAPASLTRCRPGEHVRALVDSDDEAVLLAHELQRDGRGAGRDVEHVSPGRRRSATRGPAASGDPGRRRGARRSGRSVGPSGAKSDSRVGHHPSDIDVPGRRPRADRGRRRAARTVTAVLAAEPAGRARRVYLVALGRRRPATVGSSLDDDRRSCRRPSRRRARGGVDRRRCASSPGSSPGAATSSELRAQLARLRMIEQPAGIEEAEAPRSRSSGRSARRRESPRRRYLDDVGAATRALEQALGELDVAVRDRARGRRRAPSTAFVREVETRLRAAAPLAPTCRHGRRRLRLPVRRRSRGSPPWAARVRRAAGRVGAGGAARAVRDADAEHRRRAHGGRALAGAGRPAAPDEQSVALRDAMRVLFPEAVALVSAARQGFMRER